MAREGWGRRTNQYNSGAQTLGAYVQAAMEHKRGAHDAGGLVLHQTPKAKRREFAAEVWRRRRHHGTEVPPF